MLVKLFEADHITVIWEKVKYSSWEDYIRLLFTIQVNWKLKTVTSDFELINWEDGFYQLKNWKEWSILHKALRDIGYTIWPEDIHELGGINLWIQTVIEVDSFNADLINWPSK